MFEMRVRCDKEEISGRAMSDWQKIRWWMNAHKISPIELATVTGFNQDFIERGLKGEPLSIPIGFLRNIATNWLFKACRTDKKTFSCPVDDMTYDQLMDHIGPPPAMPPRQGNFWEWDDD